MSGILLLLSPLSAGIDPGVWKKSIWILLFDFVMLYVAATLCGFLTALIATLTLMNSFVLPYKTPLLRATGCWIFWRNNRWWKTSTAIRRWPNRATPCLVENGSDWGLSELFTPGTAAG